MQYSQRCVWVMAQWWMVGLHLGIGFFFSCSVCVCTFSSVPNAHNVSWSVSQRSQPPCWFRASFPWANLLPFIDSAMSGNKHLLFFCSHPSLSFSKQQFPGLIISKSTLTHTSSLFLAVFEGSALLAWWKANLLFVTFEVLEMLCVIFEGWVSKMLRFTDHSKSFCHFSFFWRLSSNLRERSLHHINALEISHIVSRIKKLHIFSLFLLCFVK